MGKRDVCVARCSPGELSDWLVLDSARKVEENLAIECIQDPESQEMDQTDGGVHDMDQYVDYDGQSGGAEPLDEGRVEAELNAVGDADMTPLGTPPPPEPVAQLIVSVAQLSVAAKWPWTSKVSFSLSPNDVIPIEFRNSTSIVGSTSTVTTWSFDNQCYCADLVASNVFPDNNLQELLDDGWKVGSTYARVAKLYSFDRDVEKTSMFNELIDYSKSAVGLSFSCYSALMMSQHACTVHPCRASWSRRPTAGACFILSEERSISGSSSGADSEANSQELNCIARIRYQ